MPAFRFSPLLIALFALLARAVTAYSGEDQLTALGIRKLESEHLTLYTDVPASAPLDELPRMFDQAVPQWAKFFQIDADRVTRWRLTGHLIKDKARFAQAGLLTDQTPNFDHGYSIDYRFWLFDQPSDYYRAHLLLHEATHSFMNTVLGGCGPTWFMEGVAELLGTHRWRGGQLTLGYFPQDRDEVPYWGRIKLVKDDLARGRHFTFRDVMNLEQSADATSSRYGWWWAAVAFLNGHPRYRERFREIVPSAAEDDFDGRLLGLFANDWRDLELEWAAFCADLDYGYDFDRAAIEVKAPPRTIPVKLEIDAARGWQATGIKLTPGKTYHIRASGRYEVAQRPKPWVCEPPGVTIRYYRGRPLGMLLAAVRPSDGEAAAQAKDFINPIAIGADATITPERAGELYLKINEGPATLTDNRGSLEVAVEAQSAAK